MDTAASAATNPAAPAAGWFSDPHAPDLLRWWNGAQWTEHVHPLVVAQPAVQAAPQPAFRPVHQAPAAYTPTPYAPLNGNACEPQPNFAGQPATGATFAQPAAAPAFTQPATSSSSLIDSNPKSMVAIGVSILYLAIALYTGVVLIGIVPALFAFRAIERREKLAPLAVIAAVVAVVFAVTHMRHA